MLTSLNRQTAAYPKGPEKIVQFGGGNFLRAFADWAVDILNEQTQFNAGVVIVKPTPNGSYTDLIAQDGLFHVRLTGSGRTAPHLVRCVNRVVNPYADFAAYLALAQHPDIRFILSNTTEAGIAFDPAARQTDAPASSFPGKLTQFLYARFRHFTADPDKGCIILPCELIEQNGDQLGQIVLNYADLWQLEPAFKDWLEAGSVFCNTLVDRIVSGFPTERAEDIWRQIGCEDRLLVEGEAYHQWIIQAPDWVAAALPVAQTNLNIRFVDDLIPYRKLKVRILNGAHTALVPVGYLCGLETVGEAMADEIVGRFITNLLYQEVLPTLDFPESERQSYAEAILQRFRNPDIHHRLLDIALNSVSKYRVRLLPTLLDYQAQYGRLPERIVFALAALICFYRGQRNGQPIALRDDPAVLAWFARRWQNAPPWPDMARAVLRQETFWGRDLTAVPVLPERLSYYLMKIETEGIHATLQDI